MGTKDIAQILGGLRFQGYNTSLQKAPNLNFDSTIKGLDIVLKEVTGEAGKERAYTAEKRKLELELMRARLKKSSGSGGKGGKKGGRGGRRGSGRKSRASRRKALTIEKKAQQAKASFNAKQYILSKQAASRDKYMTATDKLMKKMKGIDTSTAEGRASAEVIKQQVIRLDKSKNKISKYYDRALVNAEAIKNQRKSTKTVKDIEKYMNRLSAMEDGTNMKDNVDHGIESVNEKHLMKQLKHRAGKVSLDYKKKQKSFESNKAKSLSAIKKSLSEKAKIQKKLDHQIIVAERRVNAAGAIESLPPEKRVGIWGSSDPRADAFRRKYGNGQKRQESPDIKESLLVRLESLKMNKSKVDNELGKLLIDEKSLADKTFSFDKESDLAKTMDQMKQINFSSGQTPLAQEDEDTVKDQMRSNLVDMFDDDKLVAGESGQLSKIFGDDDVKISGIDRSNEITTSSLVDEFNAGKYNETGNDSTEMPSAKSLSLEPLQDPVVLDDETEEG